MQTRYAVAMPCNNLTTERSLLVYSLETEKGIIRVFLELLNYHFEALKLFYHVYRQKIFHQLR